MRKMQTNASHNSIGLTIAALALLFFLGFQLLEDLFSVSTVSASEIEPPAISNPVPVTELPPIPTAPGSVERQGVFRSLYDSYVVTQGLHGYSYGHMAVDIAAGKGAKIRSPINGIVSDRYTDSYGNTTLILENQRFRVTLLHGDYLVNPGESVEMGQLIGTESNHGYTTDLTGRSCAGRDCGYHTHLNLFDKKLGQNIDPMIYLDD